MPPKLGVPFLTELKEHAVSTDSPLRLRRRLLAPVLLALTASVWGIPAWSQANTLPKEVRIGFQKGSAILVLARKQQVIGPD